MEHSRFQRLVSICFFVPAFFSAGFLVGCADPEPPVVETVEEETLARTEFTDRIENFFEYTPLRSGGTSQFLIHLTDLDDGAPVEQATVGLLVLAPGGQEVFSTTAQVGRVTGIYVAEVEGPAPGIYDIRFNVRNETIDETMVLSGFEVQ